MLRKKLHDISYIYRENIYSCSHEDPTRFTCKQYI